MTFDLNLDLEHTLDAGRIGNHRVQVWPAICPPEEPTFVTSLKCPHITWPLTSTLTLSTPWMQAYLGTIVCMFGGDISSHLPVRRTNFHDITEVPVSRDLWPRPWPWAHPGCRPRCEPSFPSLVAIQPFACEKKRFSWNHKNVRVTWPLNSTFTLSTLSPSGDHGVQVWSRSSHLSGRRSDLRKMFTDRRTDGRTDDRCRTIALMEWAKNWKSSICKFFIFLFVFNLRTAKTGNWWGWNLAYTLGSMTQC